MTDVTTWIELLKNGGLALAVVVLVLGGIRQWYFWPWYVLELRQERDTYKRLAETGTTLAERGTRVAESAVKT